MARINAPLLHDIHVAFYNQLIFDIPRLSHIINRVETFNRLNATVSFSGSGASLKLSSETDDRLLLGILCRPADWQLSSLAQFCGMSLHPISTLETLTVTINSHHLSNFGQVDVEHSQWEELLYLFTNVKNLYLDEDLGLLIATALQGLVGESVAQVLPALQGLFIKGLQPLGPTREAAESFVAARQRFGCSIAIHRWEEESKTKYSFDESEEELGSEWESDSEVDD